MKREGGLNARLQRLEILVAGHLRCFQCADCVAGWRRGGLSVGRSIAYTRLGLPDIGVTTLTELSDTLALIADRVVIPIIIDADNGFGNALNVHPFGGHWPSDGYVS